jgi:two-component system OmpR family response regulator
MSRRLLLVDDASDIRAIARLSLERVGDWSVVGVDSGRSAIHALAHDGPFDAILLDVMMPGMDGADTLHALRAAGLDAGVAVVFLTAKLQGAEEAHLDSLGVAGVIAKPFDPLTLPAELDSMIEAHRRRLTC